MDEEEEKLRAELRRLREISLHMQNQNQFEAQKRMMENDPKFQAMIFNFKLGILLVEKGISLEIKNKE